MEKKENKTRLRLVKTDEPIANEAVVVNDKLDQPPRSKFALQMNSFADELDRMIESILRS